MTAGFRVRPAQLADVVQRLGALDAHLQSVLAQVERRVDELHLTWSGEAAQAQRATHDEWQRGAAQMRAGLATMRSIAATAHANYVAAATANVRMWDQLR
jgi:WXG100 family type VII secretion target